MADETKVLTQEEAKAAYEAAYEKELRDAYIAEQKAIDPNFTFVDSVWQKDPRCPVWSDTIEDFGVPKGTENQEYKGPGDIFPAIILIAVIAVVALVLFV